MTKDEAMRLALEALENAPIEYDFHGNPMDAEFGKQLDAAVQALRQAQTEPPTQNPPFNFTRYVDDQEMAEGVVIEKEASLPAAIKRAVSLCPQRQNTVLVYVPLNREWVGLTDKEIDDLWNKHESRFDFYSFSCDIEAKLKEKNT